MSTKRTLYGTVSRLLGGGTNSRSSAPPRNQLNTSKKDGSVTLLSSDTTQNCRELKDVPGPWPSLPFIGTGWQYFPGSRYCLTTMHEAAEDKYHRYGPIVKEEFQWGKPSVQIYNPEDFETVFRYQGRYPFRPISEFLAHYREKHPEKYDSAGLGNTLGEQWERLRKVVGPILLKPKALDFLMGSMNEVADDFVNLLRFSRNHTTFLIDNTQDLAYRFALEGVYMMSLDDRLGCLDTKLHKDTPAADMILSVKLLFESFQELFFAPPLWKIFETDSYKKLDKAESLMYSATSKRIQQAVEKLRNTAADPNQKGVLHTLIQKKELNDKELIVTVMDLISGGIFTVANSLSFLIYHISRNPDVQEKLHKELQQHMPSGEITTAGLSGMKYLKACVKESFRLTPTIPCINRILPDDVVLSGYHIPAGTSIFCNFPIPCKQADVFPDPERFLPDRWLDRTALKHNPFTLVPFGFGQKMCVGRKFADMEMNVSLAKLVYNFKIEPAGKEVKTKSAFILVPSNPVSVILKDRGN